MTLTTSLKKLNHKLGMGWMKAQLIHCPNMSLLFTSVQDQLFYQKVVILKNLKLFPSFRPLSMDGKIPNNSEWA